MNKKDISDKEMIKGLIESSPAGITIVNKKGKIIYANSHAEKILGVSKKEIVSRTYYDTKWCIRDFDGNEFPKEDLPFERVKRMKKPVFNVRHTISSNNGKIRFLSINAVPLMNSDGDLQEVVCHLDDITNEMNTVRKLKKTTEDYEFITNNIGDIVTVLDENLNTIYLNGAVEEISGYTVEELLGLKPFVFIHREDIREVAENYKRTLKEGTGRAVYRMRDKYGEYKWIEGMAKTSIGRSGKSRIIVVSRDITQRKKAEQIIRDSLDKYWSLFENMSAAFAYHKVLYDRNQQPIDYIFLEVNSKFEEITGLNTKDIIGRRATEVLPGIETDPTNWIETYGKVAHTGEHIEFEDFSEPLQRWYYVTAYSPKKDYFACIFTDITDRKMNQKELKKSLRKTEFFKDLLSHDMANILNNIKSSVRLMEMWKNDPTQVKEREDIMKIITQQVERGSSLISNVRNLSKIEMIKQQGLPMDVKNVLEIAVRHIGSRFHNRKIHIKTQMAEGEINVEGGKLLLDAFENILLNACMHNENKEIRIWIKLSKKEQNNKNFVKIEFMDNGLGISQQRKEQIFKKSYTRKRGEGGMGIGLSLVQEIITGYGGRIWVEERVKEDHTKGSNFIILLRESE